MDAAESVVGDENIIKRIAQQLESERVRSAKKKTREEQKGKPQAEGLSYRD